MKSFDEWFGNGSAFYYMENDHRYVSRVSYEAGAQSRQSEVDELKSIIEGWKDEYRIMTLRYENLKGENHES